MDVKTITLASGATVPALGQGTWYPVSYTHLTLPTTIRV